MQCKEVMKTHVFTCHSEDDVVGCAQLMRKHNIGFVPVVDDRNRVVGTITDRDLAIRLIAENKPLSTKVSNCMTRDLVFCRPDDDLREATRLLAAEKKSRILVLDDQGRCAGVISLSDVGRVEDTEEAGRVFREVTERESQIH